MKVFLWPILAFGAAICSTASAAPVLVGGKGDVGCRDAFQLANVAYRSKQVSLTWPIADINGTSSVVVLKQNDADISGGDGIWANPLRFAKTEQLSNDLYRFWLFWGKADEGGRRLVVVDRPRSWRGDTYDSYYLNSRIPVDKFVADLRQDFGRAATFVPVDEGNWLPPLVLSRPDGTSQRLIVRGNSWSILEDWIVYGGAGTQVCRVAIGFNEKRRGLAGLPAAVRQFEKALEATLSSGADEGTMQTTARLRLNVKRGWANADMRPWSNLVPEPYNSRAEVDRGLKTWANADPWQAKKYRRIQSLYPQAEQAMTAFYMTGGYGQQQARIMARRVIDRVFRAHFLFPRSEPNW